MNKQSIEKFNIDHPLLYYLRTVMHKTKRSADSILEPHNISGQQGRIIGIIAEKQEKGTDVCQKDIEAALGITGASVTGLLQGMEKKGLINRKRSTKDDRIKELTLTSKGKDLVTLFIKVFDDTEKRISKVMTESQKEMFLKVLRLIDKEYD
jgi:DNA-binding MarR family transcriptional regulator